MDAVAVETVLEVHAHCGDRSRAAAALAEALAGARAPRRSSEGSEHWTVRMDVDAALAARAQIVDDSGEIVAERTLRDRSGNACVPFARAVGAWAQIVLDDELAHSERASSPAAPEVEEAPRPPRVEVARSAPPEVDAARPIPVPSHLEAGASLYLRNGIASDGGVAGVAPFLVVEVAAGWLVRPSLAVGTSTTRIPVDRDRSALLTHLGGRVDVCRRVPGNYIDRRGIELDACVGGDVGHVSASDDRGDTPSAWRVSFGPALVLRGELGDNIGLELRGLTGLNLLRSPLLADSDAPLLVGAAEIGASVRFR